MTKIALVQISYMELNTLEKLRDCMLNFHQNDFYELLLKAKPKINVKAAKFSAKIKRYLNYQRKDLLQNLMKIWRKKF